MRRCLTVAHQTLRTDALDRAVQERLPAGPHEFHVVAPAVPVHDDVEGAGAHAADAIVVSTPPRGRSRWLRRDLPSRPRKGCDVPVTHLVAETGADVRT